MLKIIENYLFNKGWRKPEQKTSLTIHDLRLRVKDDWMQTYSGKKIWLLNPKPEDYDINDIAHALSLKCRFNGQCSRFYSIAQHSYHVWEKAPLNRKLEALLHDGHESVVLDMITPLKKVNPEYQVIENYHQHVMGIQFNIPSTTSSMVDFIDKKMLITEASQLMNKNDPWWEDEKYIQYGSPFDMVIKCWSPSVAKRKFLQAYHQTIKGT